MSNQNPPLLEAPHGLFLESGNPQVVETFPEAPEEGAVYFTPSMEERGSNRWNELSFEQKELELNRRINLLGAVGAASGGHMTHLKEQNRIAEAEREEATLLSLTDELTGLKNRRAFIQHLEQEVLTLQDEDDPRLDVIFIDLDRFKQVNDTLGHDEGDKLLKKVADKFQEIFRLREGDEIFRLGGDEFVIVARTKKMSNNQREEREEDEAIAGLVNRLQVEGVGPAAEEMGVPYVTASIGAVKHRPNESAEKLLRRADAEMYRIKRARNRARVAAEQPGL